MKLFSIFLHVFAALSLFHVSSGYAYKWLPANRQTIGQACKTAVSNTAIYCSNDSTKTYKCQCSDVVGLGAYVYCGYNETTHSPHLRKYFEEWLISKCPKLTHEKIVKSYENVTKYLTSTSEIKNFNVSVPIRVPVKYNTKKYKYAYDSVHQRYLNVDTGMYFGIGLLGYWAGIFAIFAIYRVLVLLNVFDKFISSLKFVKFLQANVFLKPIYGKSLKQNYFLSSVTSDALIIFFFVMGDIVGCFVNIHFLPNNTIWAAKGVQLSRLVGDRSGRIAIFTMTLTFLFAGRNNFILWCTGWNFQSFLMYHKWVARMTIFNVLVHAISFLINTCLMGKYTSRSATGWYRWGCVAVVCAATILIQASYPLRKYRYEVFLYGHIILACFFIIGSLKHLVDFQLQHFAYASIAIWALDRILRVTRIINFGGFRRNNIKIVNNDFMILTIDNYNKIGFNPKPGNFVFVYFGLKSCFWQSHPFTIMSCDSNHIKLIVRIKKGCTKKVHDHIIAANVKTMNIHVALEGPYGVTKSRSIAKHENILFYSTNTGVSGPYSYLKKFIDKDVISGKNIKFYWSIRNWDALELFEEELKIINQYDSITTVIAISRYNEFASGDNYIAKITETENFKDFEEKEKTDSIEVKTVSKKSIDFTSIEGIQLSLPNIIFTSGRLNIQSIITEDINECREHTTTTIMTCGHPEFVDDVRNVVIQNIKENPKKVINFVDELQIW